jgi:hypothetical protein
MKKSLVIILLFAAALRVVFIAGLERSDIGAALPLDMRFYFDLASSLAGGGSLPAGALTFNPLYPVFLVVVFRLFGPGLLAVRILQAVAGIVTILLVFRAGRELGSSNGEKGPSRAASAAAAAAIAALYPQLLIYEGGLVATSLVTLIFAASFALALAIAGKLDRPDSGRIPVHISAVLLGILVGAGSLGRPNIFLILAVLVPLWLLLRAGRRKLGIALASLCVAGTIAALAPPVIFSSVRAGRFVPVTAHGGINFYIGNRSGANGLYQPPEGMRGDMRGLIEDARKAAEAMSGRRMSDGEVSDHWMRLARERIAADPAGWLGLLARKTVLFWNGVEIGDVLDERYFKEEFPVLRIALVGFPLISPLAFIGMVVIAARHRERWIVLIFLSASVAAVTLFFFNSRYRIPSVPLLIAAAGWLVAWLAWKIGSRDWKRAAVAVAGGALFFLLVTNRDMAAINRSATYTFLGNHYMRQGRFEDGAEAYAEAYRLDPTSPYTKINYARSLKRMGDYRRAAELYGSVYGALPDLPGLALEYGSLLDDMGDKDAARELYLYAYERGRRGDRVFACKFLSRMAYLEGRRGEARGWIERAIEIAPGDESLQAILEGLKEK